MYKRLIEIDANTYKEDITIGKLYDVINEGFLDDAGDWRGAEFIEWQEAPNPPLAHSDIRKAAADGWPIEVKTSYGDWRRTKNTHYSTGDEYRVAPLAKTTTQIRLEEIEIEINTLIAEGLELKDD